MRNLLVFMTLTAATASWAENAYQVVSDIDDTVRITDSGNSADALYRAAFTREVFAGVPEEFRALSDQASLTFVSGSPRVLTDSVGDLLDAFKFPSRTLILKNWLQSESLLNYKTRVISELIKSSTQSFILLGDDTQSDPEVLAGLKNIFPNRISAALIHQVSGRTIPSEVQGYVTSFESALLLHSKGILSATDAAAVGYALQEATFDKIIPDFAAKCSTGSGIAWAADTQELQKLSDSISSRIQSGCKNRN